MLTQKPELINCDLTVNHKTTPLHRVSLLGNLELAKVLIETFKADPNFKTTSEETPLMAAAKRDKLDLVEYLLDHDANADIISSTGLNALDYAILQGNYECALAINQRMKVTKIKSPYEYFNLCYKYKYRWVDYEIVVDSLEKGIPRENVKEFLKKPKKKYVDPVVDPRETWKAWIVRNVDFVDPPMVERSELPDEMQPQNQNFAKLRHFVTRMTISPLSQKPTLNPRVI